MFRAPLTLCGKTCKTGPGDEIDTHGDFSKFSYEDFDIKDKQKIVFLGLSDVYVSVCLNWRADNF